MIVPKTVFLILKTFLFTFALMNAGLIHATDGKNVIGFVMSDWRTKMYETLFMDECPQGPAIGNYELWEASQTPEVRREKQAPVFAITEHLNRRGRNGENVCLDPTSVEDPPLSIIEGKYAYGINLDGNSDGDATENTCKHDNFIGLNGETGIDNQMYRLFGCVEAWRSYGHIESNANAHRLSSGFGMVLIEIADVDDRQNDESVEVSFYRGLGPYQLDSNGTPLAYVSYTVDYDNGQPRYKSVVPGKIVDGLLVTEPNDVNLPFFGNYQYAEQVFRDMRLHLQLSANEGKTNGSIYGYAGVDQTYAYVRGMLDTFPNRHKYSCPAIYVAAHQLADGHPDPETGECTTLSSAFDIKTVSAFIVHPE